jgi:hypothetical protein
MADTFLPSISRLKPMPRTVSGACMLVHALYGSGVYLSLNSPFSDSIFGL